jgi:hypothetical protein
MGIRQEIADSIRAYPSLYACRTDVLHQWFCVNGNGMEWQGGRLVTGYHERPRTLDEIIAEGTGWMRERLEDPIMSGTSHESQFRARMRALIAKTEMELRFRYENADDLALVPWDGTIRRSPGLESDFAPRPIYPLCEYACMNTVPDDVDPEYLAAVREMICEVFDAPGTSMPHDAGPEDHERALEANRAFADVVLQDLAQRFPDVSTFKSRADREERRAQLWKNIQGSFKKMLD